MSTGVGACSELYRGHLDRHADLGAVLQRTEGVTASFLKELMRRSALAAAEGAALKDWARGRPPINQLATGPQMLGS